MAMFDSLKLDHKLDKETFKTIEATLRDELLDAQRELQERRTHAIMILINGVDGAGKGEVLNRLYEWLDPRFLDTNAVDIRDEINTQWPVAWHYWRKMPAKGQICAVLGSWYHVLLRERALGNIDHDNFMNLIAVSREYETMLDQEGVKVLKLWLHLPPEEAERRYKKARKQGNFRRPLVQEWADIPLVQNKQALQKAAKELAQIISPNAVPWSVIPAEDQHYRDVAIGQEVLKLMRQTFMETPCPPGNDATRVSADTKTNLPRPSIISSIDLTKTITPEDYKKELQEEQHRIFQLTSSKAFRKHGLIIAFEGNDAAGKGGAIRRIRQALDPREFTVHAISAPTQEELAHPYLWRFWRALPQKGNTAIFDRSWYGRVLVERVEEYCSVADWKRAYSEINAFEQQLSNSGYIIIKFWLAISQEEQLRRFEARAETPYKQFKITAEDWRNREKWPLYEEAITDMVDNTSTNHAPWTLVPANDKHYARIKVLKTVAARLEEGLD